MIAGENRYTMIELLAHPNVCYKIKESDDFYSMFSNQLSDSSYIIIDNHNRKIIPSHVIDKINSKIQRSFSDIEFKKLIHNVNFTIKGK